MSRAIYVPSAYVNGNLAVYQIDSMDDFSGIDLDSIISGQDVILTGFYTGSLRGGGVFKWDPTEDKANHNGGTIIDPTHGSTPGVAAWYSDAQSGSGCFIRQCEEIFCQHFGPANNGTTDDTIPVQAAVDAAYYAKKKVYVDGEYAVTSIKIYGKESQYSDSGVANVGWRGEVDFEPGSKFVNIGTTFPIRTSVSPTTDVRDRNIRGVLRNPVVDMDGSGAIGILLECAQMWVVENPEVQNVPSGTFTYDDGNGVDTYQRCGIALKGVVGEAGAYMNRIINPFIYGISVASMGNRGIWLGTNPTGSPLAYSQTANGNKIEGGYYRYLTCGIYVDDECGNNRISGGEFSKNTTCIYINEARRTVLEKNYLESSTTGIEIADGTNYTFIYEIASIAGTTYPLVDGGVNTVVFPENYIARAGIIDASGGTTGTLTKTAVGDRNVGNESWTRISFDTDVDNSEPVLCDSAHNDISVDSGGDGEGWYQITGSILIAATGAGVTWLLGFYKNESLHSYNTYYMPADIEALISFTDLVYLDANDSLELYVYQDSGVTKTVTGNKYTKLAAARQMTPINEAFNRTDDDA